MLLQKCALTVLVAPAMALGGTPATANPFVFNPNFVDISAALNATYGTGDFFLQHWTPAGFATNSLNDPGQYDNGLIGPGVPGVPQSVGFLSGPGTSFSQVVDCFVVDPDVHYRVSLSVNARSAPGSNPLFEILVDNATVYAPTLLTRVDVEGAFGTAFQYIETDSFSARSTALKITLANAPGSDLNATTLLTDVFVSQVFNPPAVMVGSFDVPEPISVAILGVGLIGTAAVRRRLPAAFAAPSPLEEPLKG